MVRFWLPWASQELTTKRVVQGAEPIASEARASLLSRDTGQAKGKDLRSHNILTNGFKPFLLLVIRP